MPWAAPRPARRSDLSAPDARFQRATELLTQGDVAGLEALLRREPWLATATPGSRQSLLQDVAVNGGLGRIPEQLALARVLVEAGAALDAPFVAAASVGNLEVGGFLLECGVDPNGTGSWTPLEEALYWRHGDFVALLLSQGARVEKLRVAAGLGDLERLQSCFLASGELVPGQDVSAWPFGPLPEDQRSSAPREVLGNALVFAAVNDQPEAVDILLARGAPLDDCPPGTHYRGTALHAAIWKGGRGMVRFLLERGADPRIVDGKYGDDALGWARHLQREDLLELLEAWSGDRHSGPEAG